MGRFIIDVREPEEYAISHSDTAINIPLSELMNSTKMLNHIPKDAEVIMYCNSGNRSGTSKKILESMGYTNVINGINEGYVRANYR